MIQENGPDDPTLDVVSIEMLPLCVRLVRADPLTYADGNTSLPARRQCSSIAAL